MTESAERKPRPYRILANAMSDRVFSEMSRYNDKIKPSIWVNGPLEQRSVLVEELLEDPSKGEANFEAIHKIEVRVVMDSVGFTPAIPTMFQDMLTDRFLDAFANASYQEGRYQRFSEDKAKAEEFAKQKGVSLKDVYVVSSLYLEFLRSSTSPKEYAQVAIEDHEKYIAKLPEELRAAYKGFTNDVKEKFVDPLADAAKLLAEITKTAPLPQLTDAEQQAQDAQNDAAIDQQISFLLQRAQEASPLLSIRKRIVTIWGEEALDSLPDDFKAQIEKAVEKEKADK